MFNFQFCVTLLLERRVTTTTLQQQVQHFSNTLLLPLSTINLASCTQWSYVSTSSLSFFFVWEGNEDDDGQILANSFTTTFAFSVALNRAYHACPRTHSTTHSVKTFQLIFYLLHILARALTLIHTHARTQRDTIAPPIVQCYGTAIWRIGFKCCSLIG